MNKTRASRPGRQRIVAGLILLSFGIAACSPGSGRAQGAAGDPAAGPGVSQTTGPFRAVVTSAIGVDLSWDPVDGATGYRIENRFADSEWFVLGEVDAAQTTFADFPAPSKTELQYRLVPLMGGQDGDALVASATTPEVAPHPYSVTITLEEPDYSEVAENILGFDPSILETLDPSTFNPLDPSFDPSSLIPTVDPQNLDLSTVGPEPVTALARIGPEGGSVSITGSKGVVYTLTIPENALRFTTIFALTPVKEIQGYPFSGGYQAAVQIEPEGIYFDAPATISFEFPEGTAPPEDSGLHTVAFAFQDGGQEFHLVPLAEPGEVSGRHAGGRLARPVASPSRTIFTIDADALQSRSAGVGQASSSEVKEFTEKNPPTSPEDRADQDSAASQSREDQAQGKADRQSANLLERINTAGNVAEFVDIVVADFRAFYASKGYRDLEPSRKDELWEAAVEAANRLMTTKQCPSPEAAAVQELVWRLRSPQSAFDREFARRYIEAKGQAAKERLGLLAAIQSCRVKLVVTSRATISDLVCSLEVRISVSNLNLYPRRRDGKDQFQGAGAVVYEGQPRVLSGECRSIDEKDLQGSSFVVYNLDPKFAANGDVIDWTLSYNILGSQSEAKGASTSSTGYGMALGGGPTDLWGGVVTAAGGWLGEDKWKIRGKLPVLAEWYGESTSIRGVSRATHQTLLELVPR